MNPSDIKTDGTASHEEVQPNDKSGTEPHKVTLAQGDGEGSTKISLQVWLAILALAVSVFYITLAIAEQASSSTTVGSRPLFWSRQC